MNQLQRAESLFEEFMKIPAIEVYTLPVYDDRPVILYGAGQMGRMSLCILQQAKVEVLAVLDNNPANQGTRISGIPVISPSSIEKEWCKTALFAVSVMKVAYNEIRDSLQALGCQNICYVGHLIHTAYQKPSVANVWTFDGINSGEKNAMTQLFSALEDTFSRDCYVQFLSWQLKGNELPFAIAPPDEKYYIPEVLHALGEQEIFVDCGAYNGSSIEKFLRTAPYPFYSCYSFEPEPENYARLCQYAGNSPFTEQIHTFPFGLGNHDGHSNFLAGMGFTSRYTDAVPGTKVEIHKLDTVMDNEPYSFLKIYGLGIGNEVIEGALTTIQRNRPLIAVNIHHTRMDFIRTPKLLLDNLERYVFLFRLHAYCGSDAVLYAIPRERIKNQKEV